LEAVAHLAGGIAHDFNNLLMVINGFGEMLVGRLPEGEELEAAQQILAAGERAAALTRQLLAFASPGLQRAEIVDLAAIVRGVLPLVQRTLGEHIVVTLETTAHDPWVSGERTQLEQVLVNLAFNARDAMPEGGRLIVELSDAPEGSPGLDEMADGAVLLSVTDTGRGIAEEIRERVFLPFFTTKADRGGSGLGLATVHATARASGGRAWVERNGRPGATIRFMIPRAAGPPPPDPAEASGPDASDADPTAVRDTSGIILVAEDEPAVLALIERVLRAAGYTVVGVPSGPEALDAAADRLDDLDLLVTDAIMPGMAGLELARLLRLERANLPILFVSGWASDAFEREWAGQAGVDLLIKPFDVGELLVRVTALTSRGAGGRVG
jgi:CheY-like chemotaxis protein